MIQKEPVDYWLIDPMRRFINNSTTSGIVLFSSALLALIFANSPLAEVYHQIWRHKFSIGYDEFVVSKDLHHWINDGLMAVFFFVIGLELKREIVAGELSNPKKAVLPLAAAIGGMVAPALVYAYFNAGTAAASGWGIPMATDIAFALGVLYLLGDRVPLSLKVFLTVLAIADDLGAVLVIAFVYTSYIDFTSLMAGGIFLSVMIAANIIGVRNTVFYAILGIGGVWLAFLLSGVHATIAAVLAAFTIPVKVKIEAQYFSKQLGNLIVRFNTAEKNNLPTVTDEQHHVLEEIRETTTKALTPLQRLEHRLHPIVAFIIMPIFAFSNAGVSIIGTDMTELVGPVSIGTSLGLIIGKLIGVVGVVYLFTVTKWADLPQGMNMQQIWGVGFLAAIGFTMSLFITDLAFIDPDHIQQAKVGILAASLVSSIAGFLLIRSAGRKKLIPNTSPSNHYNE
jgi:Na+:H+ antiporter, NhaA family